MYLPECLQYIHIFIYIFDSSPQHTATHCNTLQHTATQMKHNVTRATHRGAKHLLNERGAFHKSDKWLPQEWLRCAAEQRETERRGPLPQFTLASNGTNVSSEVETKMGKMRRRGRKILRRQEIPPPLGSNPLGSSPQTATPGQSSTSTPRMHPRSSSTRRRSSSWKMTTSSASM